MFEGQQYQTAYVTRDVDAAMTRFRSQADVRLDSQIQMPIAIRTGAGETATMDCKLGFIWVGATQYEFIQPLAGWVDMYRDFLPSDDSLALHHICQRVADWDDFRSRVDRQPYPLVMEGESGPLKFLYLDARADLGHYLEYTAMPDAMWTMLGGL